HRLECIAHLIASMFLFTIPPPPPSTLFPYTTLFRSTRVLAFDYLHRVSLQASHPVVLGNAVRNFNAAGQVEQRILSKGNRDLAGQALGKILLTHDAALLAGRDIEAEGIAVMNHDPISAEIDPALVRMTRTVYPAGAHIS